MMNKNYVNLLLFFVYSAFLLPKNCAASTGVSVGRWARFEASVKNARTYRDPYADVVLDVTCESPDGRKTRFWGFYDGMIKNHHNAKPLYAQEVFWPGNKYHKIRDQVDIRKKAFVLMMSAAAINYADMGDLTVSNRQ